MKKLHLSIATLTLLGFLSLTGCATKAENGALIGAGTGALLGQVVGKNTSSTIIGAGLGAIAGAAIGENEAKKEALSHSY
jgi:outer membrane lipoprotein SlyB